MKVTPYYLRKGARHLDNEISTLMEAGDRFWNRGRLPSDPLLRKALLESWAVHMRGLLEFFHPTKATRAQTARADHYVADRTAWQGALPALTSREEARRQALHELLAHISYCRDARKSRWSSRDHQVVTLRIALFFRHLPPRRASWFPQAQRWFP